MRSTQPCSLVCRAALSARGRWLAQRCACIVPVTVHSLGHVATTTGVAVVRDARGREVARTAIPALPAPSDLLPKTVTVQLALPTGFVRAGARVQVMQDGEAEEVTALNNTLPLD